MVDYGQNEKYLVTIPNVDIFPELCGVKIANLPLIFAMTLIPLWFDAVVISVTMFATLMSFFYWAARREDEGRPITISSTLVSWLHQTPTILRKNLCPALSEIKPHLAKFRR